MCLACAEHYRRVKDESEILNLEDRGTQTHTHKQCKVVKPKAHVYVLKWTQPLSRFSNCRILDRFIEAEL